MKPTAKSVDDVLKSIEATERDPDHPCSLARAVIQQFQLDREKGEKPLPVANVHDDKGAPLLDINDTLRRSLPDYGGRKG